MKRLRLLVPVLAFALCLAVPAEAQSPAARMHHYSLLVRPAPAPAAVWVSPYTYRADRIQNYTFRAGGKPVGDLTEQISHRVIYAYGEGIAIRLVQPYPGRARVTLRVVSARRSTVRLYFKIQETRD